MFLACLECLDPVLWAGVGSSEAIGGDGHVADDTGAETELLAGVEPDPLVEDTKGRDATDEAVASTAGVIAGGSADERKNKPPALPSVLEPLEVERMMGLLEGVDDGIRRKVCSLSPTVTSIHPPELILSLSTPDTSNSQLHRFVHPHSLPLSRDLLPYLH